MHPLEDKDRVDLEVSSHIARNILRDTEGEIISISRTTLSTLMWGSDMLLVIDEQENE